MRVLLAASAWLCVAPTMVAQVILPPGVSQITSVEGVTEYRLSNGLRALFLPEPSSPTTSVWITYLAGARQENYGESGMAHIIEHLVAFGSTKHPDAKRELREHGGKGGGGTGPDSTSYGLTFMASGANLSWAL